MAMARKLIFFSLLALLYFQSSPFLGPTWDENAYLQQTLTLRKSFEKIVARQADREDYLGLSSTYDKPQGKAVIVALASELFPGTPTITLLRLSTGVLFFLLLYLGGKLLEEEGETFTLFPLLLFFTPRLFGHAHLYAQDIDRCFGELFALYFFLRGRKDRKLALFYGVAQGIAMALHMGTWILPPILIAWGLLTRQEIRFQTLSLLLAPLVYFLLTPFLWISPLANFLFFVRLNLHRAAWDRVPLYYLGDTFRYTFPYHIPSHYPWHYPYVLFFATLPTITLSLLYLFPLRGRLSAESKLFSFLLFVPLLLLTPPSIPKYDGVRLFLPSFVYATLLASKALAKLPRKTALLLLFLHILEGSLFFLAPLSSFNALVGWTKGAYDKGFEITYWGDPFNRSLLQKLEEKIPPRAPILFLGIPSGLLSPLQAQGFFKGRKISMALFAGSEDLSSSRWLVLYGRLGLFTSTAWKLWREPATFTASFLGAPLIKVYSPRKRPLSPLLNPPSIGN